MAGSWGVSNPPLKDDEARASGFFVGDSDLTDPSIKYLLKRRRKGEQDFDRLQ